MKVGWAYMGLAALLVIAGTIISISGNGIIGDILLVLSIPTIYYGSKSLAAEREAETETEEVA
ncbi:hypothetical protein halTADL_1722 [Halohasta litchfieldiae]|uniref:Uncharacterized protein n=2 Tax=Halohasta litchfieldiae TaxID=1073996 RepID=A0A1H6R6C3_9EURY|nr:hypothetical protein [Halohasta litchfieldiae]ATW88476.1 hypothetical protein halTADL_1722 [Halohasta litchfieldiae]SEI50016.1 hypothetical protein SAMN05444271_101243 [Halohasta litchfieldiae]